jgi:hypothetical protein
VGLIGWELGGAMSFMKLMISHLLYCLGCSLFMERINLYSKCVIVYFGNDMGLNILAAIVQYLQKLDWNFVKSQESD